jgi:CRP-like cAMP-binding protein
MKPVRLRIRMRAAEREPVEVGAPAAATRRRAGIDPLPKEARPGDAEARADAIARAAPFTAWPRDALLRLAAGASVANHSAEAALIVKGERCDQITVVVDGTVLASASTPGGRRLTYKIDNAAFAYGLSALVDGLPLQIDLVADGPVTTVRISIAEVRAELMRTPALWESVAVESTRRSRRYATQLNQLVLDTPRLRAASLLMDLLAMSGRDGVAGAAVIDARLSQERLADMLGVSRQWATAVVRELVQDGLVEWRYGRVVVLDVQALRSLAAQGVEGLEPRRRPAAPLRPAGTAAASANSGAGIDANGGARRRPN